MNNAAGLFPRLAPVLFLTFLAGCTAANLETSPTPEASTVVTPEAAPRAAAVPAPTPKPKPEPEIDVPNPAEVIGWDTAALNAAFGPASLVRRDLGAEIWQYRTEECVLFLFLYPTGTESALKVEHLDARGDARTDTCLKSVVRRFAARG